MADKEIKIDGEFVTIKKGAIIESSEGTGITEEDITVFIGVGSGSHPVMIKETE